MQEQEEAGQRSGQWGPLALYLWGRKLDVYAPAPGGFPACRECLGRRAAVRAEGKPQWGCTAAPRGPLCRAENVAREELTKTQTAHRKCFINADIPHPGRVRKSE